MFIFISYIFDPLHAYKTVIHMILSVCKKLHHVYGSMIKLSRQQNSIPQFLGYEIHGRKAGSVATVEFEIEGQEFIALNGGPIFKFNEAISFQVCCETQEEVDYYWQKLSEGGDEKAWQCGWLKDKYGVSWQIIPTVLIKMLKDKDTKKSDRVMKVMLQMHKLDINILRQAFEEI